MISRRTFLGTVGAAALTGAAPADPPAKKKLAVVTTLWNYHSHAWHMAERFLHGYPIEGRWHRPPFPMLNSLSMAGGASTWANSMTAHAT